MASEFKVLGMPHSAEDIVLCVDVDSQVETEMKVTGAQGQPPLTRLDAIKQALLLFAHTKLVSMAPPQHRIAIATIGATAAWHLRHYASDFEEVRSSLRRLSSQGSFSTCDLSSLLRLIAADASASVQQGRCFRVVLVYCRSDVVPSLGPGAQRRRNLVLDALYLHDKPGPNNCPQRVYDVLVEALERVDPLRGYVYETSRSLTRLYIRHACLLLAHPQQRCPQDEFDASLRDLAPPPLPPPNAEEHVALNSKN